jgi:hypothetical protein
MPSFVKGGGSYTDPFGPNEYRRSTKGLKYESYTIAASTVPTETINGVTGQKVLQRGEVLAKITSGPEIGKVGPFAAGTPVVEVQTVTISGTPSGGTFRLAYNGMASAAIAYNAAASVVQSALNGIPALVSSGQQVAVTGSAGGPYTVTFQDPGDASTLTLDTNSLTGGSSPTVAVATTTPGSVGTGTGAATDGRSDPANIVGINDTYLPWQLLNHDEQVAACYVGDVVQAWCFQRNAAGARVALDDSVARYMINRKHMQINFH